jgi:hypothetical protein
VDKENDMSNLDPINQIWLYHENLLKKHLAGKLSIERFVELASIVQLWYDQALDKYHEDEVKW